MPKVSIITPCYNCGSYIGGTIESVVAQTMPDWEQIVVDDGSTDGSASIVETYSCDEPRIRLIRQANSGVARARNVGFQAVSESAEYLLFLDADDCLDAHMLEEMLGYLGSVPHVGMVYCDPLFVDCLGLPLSPHPRTPPRYVPGGLAVKQLPRTEPHTPFVSVFSLIFTTPSVSLIRRSTYLNTTGWDEEFGQPFEDIDLFLLIALRDEIHYLPKQLVRYRRHTTQSTADPNRSAVQEFKLFRKWLTGAHLTLAERDVVTAAWLFRQGRLLPYGLLKSSLVLLRDGQCGRAVRFAGAALRRYLTSLLPDEPRRLRLLHLSYRQVRGR